MLKGRKGILKSADFVQSHCGFLTYWFNKWLLCSNVVSGLEFMGFISSTQEPQDTKEKYFHCQTRKIYAQLQDYKNVSFTAVHFSFMTGYLSKMYHASRLMTDLLQPLVPLYGKAACTMDGCFWIVREGQINTIQLTESVWICLVQNTLILLKFSICVKVHFSTTELGTRLSGSVTSWKQAEIQKVAMVEGKPKMMTCQRIGGEKRQRRSITNSREKETVCCLMSGPRVWEKLIQWLYGIQFTSLVI